MSRCRQFVTGLNGRSYHKRPRVLQRRRSITTHEFTGGAGYSRLLGRLPVYNGVSIAGCLLRMLAHIIAGVPDDDPQFYIWRLFLSLSTLAVGLILFRVRPVLEELPWPDWYAQYMLDEARLQILLSGKPVRVSGMVDRFGRRLPECEAYRGIADFDSRKLFLLFQAGPGRKFLRYNLSWTI